MITSSRRLWNAFPNCLQKAAWRMKWRWDDHKLGQQQQQEEFYYYKEQGRLNANSTISHAIVYLDDVDSWALTIQQETSFNAVVKYLVSQTSETRKSTQKWPFFFSQNASKFSMKLSSARHFQADQRAALLRRPPPTLFQKEPWWWCYLLGKPWTSGFEFSLCEKVANICHRSRTDSSNRWSNFRLF